MKQDKKLYQAWQKAKKETEVAIQKEARYFRLLHKLSKTQDSLVDVTPVQALVEVAESYVPALEELYHLHVKGLTVWCPEAEVLAMAADDVRKLYKFPPRKETV